MGMIPSVKSAMVIRHGSGNAILTLLQKVSKRLTTVDVRGALSNSVFPM